MIPIDYEYLEKLLKERGITHRKLAYECGIKEGALSAAFIRKSKMQVRQVWAIAKYLQIDPVDLLPPAEQYMGSDANEYNNAVERLRYGYTGAELAFTAQTIGDIVNVLNGLTDEARTKALEYVKLLNEIPRFKKSPEELDAEEERRAVEYVTQNELDEIIQIQRDDAYTPPEY